MSYFKINFAVLAMYVCLLKLWVHKKKVIQYRNKRIMHVLGLNLLYLITDDHNLENDFMCDTLMEHP